MTPGITFKKLKTSALLNIINYYEKIATQITQ